MSSTHPFRHICYLLNRIILDDKMSSHRISVNCISHRAATFHFCFCSRTDCNVRDSLTLSWHDLSSLEAFLLLIPLVWRTIPRWMSSRVCAGKRRSSDAKYGFSIIFLCVRAWGVVAWSFTDGMRTHYKL